MGYDGSLDDIHRVGGILGILATGWFASIGAKGLFSGNPTQVGIQGVTVVATAAFALIGTFVLLKLINAAWLRVRDEEEQRASS